MILENMQKTADFALFLGLNMTLMNNVDRKAALNELMASAPWRAWGVSYPKCAACVRRIIEKEIAACDGSEPNPSGRASEEAEDNAEQVPKGTAKAGGPSGQPSAKSRKDRKTSGGPSPVSRRDASTPKEDPTRIS